MRWGWLLFLVLFLGPCSQVAAGQNIGLLQSRLRETLTEAAESSLRLEQQLQSLLSEIQSLQRLSDEQSEEITSLQHRLQQQNETLQTLSLQLQNSHNSLHTSSVSLRRSLKQERRLRTILRIGVPVVAVVSFVGGYRVANR